MEGVNQSTHVKQGFFPIEDQPKFIPPISTVFDRNTARDFIYNESQQFFTYPSSIGSLLTCIPKILYSTIPCWFGKTIQGEHTLNTPSYVGLARFFLGAPLIKFGSLYGNVIDFVQNTIDTGVAIPINLASHTLQLLTPANRNCANRIQLEHKITAPKPIQPTTLSKQEAKSANILLYLVSKSFPSTYTEQELLTNFGQFFQSLNPDNISDLDHIIHPAFSNLEILPVCYFNISGNAEELLLSKVSYAKLDDIPDGILAYSQHHQANTDEILTLHIDIHYWRATVLRDGKQSSLCVGVFKNAANKIILAFPEIVQKESGKNDSTNVVETYDTIYKDADKLVAAFVKQHGAENVILAGYSTGGGLAQFAGINNGVQVTVFNSVELNEAQCAQLGEKINDADVTLINTHNDLMRREIEQTRSSHQLQHRFVIPEMNGTGDIFIDLPKYASEMD